MVLSRFFGLRKKFLSSKIILLSKNFIDEITFLQDKKQNFSFFLKGSFYFLQILLWIRTEELKLLRTATWWK